MDDELLQDFLIEAGEILEQLNEQLVELENSPDDSELLNAVFRGFHTIKGGAGFLAIDVMVAICHRTEDIFNMLRNDELKIDNHLMDTVLPVLDVLNDQFDALRSGEEPQGAEQELLTALESIISGESATGDAPVTSNESEDISDDEFEAMLDEAASKKEKTSADEITDEEFEALLDDLHGKNQPSDSEGSKPAIGSYEENKKNDEISEDEFESLLDDLHGKGSFSAQGTDSKETNNSYEENKKNDEISEDEFESLLDDIHGKGSFSAASNQNESTEQKTPETKQEVAKPKAQPIVKKEKVVVAAKKSEPATKTPAKDTKVVAETSVRVDTSRLDEIMNMVGELVLVRNRITRLGSEGKTRS